ncbi:unnamed protein product, partial [Iphiclides podalirius]
MSVNFITICTFASLFHFIAGQCVGSVYNAGIVAVVAPDSVLGYTSVHGAPIAPNGLSGFAPNHGGGFTVTSASPIAPNGVTIVSDHLIAEGALSVCGQLPVLGTAALEGPLPAAGQGAVEYGCGDGEVTILSENISPDSYIYVAGPAIDYSLIGLAPNVGCSYVY